MWKTIIDKTPVEIVKQLAIAVIRFFQVRHAYNPDSFDWSPFTISANYGDMNLLQYTINKIKLKNITKAERITALFMAAYQGS